MLSCSQVHSVESKGTIGQRSRLRKRGVGRTGGDRREEGLGDDEVWQRAGQTAAQKVKRTGGDKMRRGCRGRTLGTGREGAEEEGEGMEAS